jgi:hypothetical protein
MFAYIMTYRKREGVVNPEYAHDDDAVRPGEDEEGEN